MLQNEVLDVKKLVDTAENGPLQSPKSRVCGAGSSKNMSIIPLKDRSFFAGLVDEGKIATRGELMRRLRLRCVRV